MAFCPNCGSPVAAPGGSCAKCGGPSAAPRPEPVYVTPGPPMYAPSPYPTSLPDVGPLAIILAAVSWVVLGPFLSIPAIIKARSDIRGIREGRYNPAGLQMSQLAFWIGLANVALFLVIVVFIVFVFLVVGVAAGTAAKHAPRVPAPVVTTTPRTTPASEYDALEQQVETRMADRPETDRKLWRQAKDGLRVASRAKGSGAFGTVKGIDSLLKAVASDQELWTSIVDLEKKAAATAGKTAPARAPPGEAEDQ